MILCAIGWHKWKVVFINYLTTRPHKIVVRRCLRCESEWTRVEHRDDL